MVAETTLDLDSVTGDDLAGGEMIAEHLLQRGHRKIALVTSPKEGSVQVRRSGLLRRLKGEGEIVWEVMTPPSDAIEQEVRDKLRERNVTAIVCSHDEIAISLMRTLRELDIVVPQDVSVVGFDDVQWASIVTPSLTTIRQPFKELAAQAVCLLLERIAKPQRKVRRVKLSVELIERESVTEVVRIAAPRKSKPLRGKIQR
jgi:LacI family transcriptional regulator